MQHMVEVEKAFSRRVRSRLVQTMCQLEVGRGEIRLLEDCRTWVDRLYGSATDQESTIKNSYRRHLQNSVLATL